MASIAEFEKYFCAEIDKVENCGDSLNLMLGLRPALDYNVPFL
jgi:hypothetical protein